MRKLSNNQHHYNSSVHNNNGQPNNQHMANNNHQSSKNEKLAKNNNSVQKRTNNHRHQDAVAVVPMNNHHQHHRRSRFNPHSDSFVYQQYTDHITDTVTAGVDMLDYTTHQHSTASLCFDADDEYDHTSFNGLHIAGDAQIQSTDEITAKRRVRSKRSPIAADLLSETQLPHEMASAAAKSRYAQHRRHADDTIIFTDNQIYVALEPLVPDGHHDERFDYEDAHANHLNNLSSAGGRIAGTNKLTDKCPFHISSQLQDQQRRTAYANNQHNLTSNVTTTTTLAQSGHHLFEKVKFDPTKRYLQPASPSNSHADNVSPKIPAECIIPTAGSYEAFLNDKCTQARTSSMYVDDQLLDSTFVQYWPFGREPVTVTAATAKLRQQQQWQQQCQQQQQLLQQQQQHQQHQQRNQRRWNEAYEPEEPATVLDNRFNRIRIEIGGGSPSLSSASGRSSIGTAETWLDDEAFDNSMNEELERRCVAVFRR